MSDEVKPDDQQPAEQAEDGQQQETAQPEKPFAVLINRVLDSLDSYFSGQMERLLLKTDEYLFESANHASSINQQNKLFEFMNDLRVQKDDIERKFFEEFNVYLKPIEESPKLPKRKQKKQSGGLGLVDNEEMDEIVVLSGIVGKANTDFGEEITHLTARLQHIAMRNRDMFHPEALKPVHICDAFHDALLDSGFSNQNKMILYKQFDQGVLRNIKNLYDELNDMLVEADVLPEIELGGVISRGDVGGGYDDYAEEAESEAEAEAEAEQEQAPLAQQPPPQGWAGPRIGPGRVSGSRAPGAGGAPPPAAGGASAAPGTPASGAGYASAPPGGAAYGGGAPAGHAVPPSSGQPGGQPGDQANAPGGEALQGSFAGMPLGQVRQSIQDFIGGVPSDRDSSVAGGGAAGGGGYYSHGDVVSALSSLQVDTQISDTKLEFNAGAIKKAVLSTIGEKEGGIVNKRVNQVSEKTIDFIKLIFDAIIDDKSITDTIKTLLLSLQIPVIKAAMLDAEFFVDDKHPARMLLDKIAEAGVGVSDHKDPVYIDIEAVVRKLLVEYKEDVAAFKEALDALNKITEEIYAKAREREEESQKQVKHAHARNVVLQEIRKITLGNELPHGIRTLVLKVWPSLMFNHYLRKGKANDEWVEMLMILAKIIDSVQPITTRSELEELGLTYEDIVKATEDKLKLCKKSAEVVANVVNDLRATYEELMQTKDLPEEEPEEEVVEQQAPVEAEAEAEAETEATEVATAAEGEGAAEQAEAEEQHGEIPEQEISEQEIAEAEQHEEQPEEQEEDPEQIARRKLALLSSDIQPGAWFIVYNGEDKPVRRLKLAVILIQDATLVFVDHLGNVVIEKDAEAFARELERGLSGVIMQHSVFDHALKSALSSINL